MGCPLVQAQLRTRAVHLDDVTVVHLAGEVDMAVAEMVRAVLLRKGGHRAP